MSQQLPAVKGAALLLVLGGLLVVGGLIWWRHDQANTQALQDDDARLRAQEGQHPDFAKVNSAARQEETMHATDVDPRRRVFPRMILPEPKDQPIAPPAGVGAIRVNLGMPPEIRAREGLSDEETSKYFTHLDLVNAWQKAQLYPEGDRSQKIILTSNDVINIKKRVKFHEIESLDDKPVPLKIYWSLPDEAKK